VLLLSDLRITDSGLKSLMNLELIELDLSRTPITNQAIGILHNSKMRDSLEKLTLIETSLDQSSEFLKLANFSSIRKINVVGTKISLDGSLIKLQEKINDMAHRVITKITRGSIFEIHRPVKETSHIPSENQKSIWESEVGPILSPYLNQIIPWPEIIVPPDSPNLTKSKSKHSPRPNSTHPLFLTPTSSQRRPSDPLKRTPSAHKTNINNENLPPLHFDQLFPKSPQEVTGSWVLSQQLIVDVISPLSKRKYEPVFSPFTSSDKRIKKTIGQPSRVYESPLPNGLTDLLQIKSMSPSISKERKKSDITKFV
jgi:hypothetical protein